MFDKGIFPKFDKLIIDEGQDLIRSDYLNLFDSMLIGGLSNGNWEIYGDFEKQAIFSQLSKEEMTILIEKFTQPSKFLLNINCRNTKQIGEETSLLSGFDEPPFLLDHLEGVPVEYFFYKDKPHQRELLEGQIKKVSTSGLPINELIILSPRKFENSCAYYVSDPKAKELHNIIELAAIQSFFWFATVQSYKGMESNYVFVTDIEDLTSDAAKSLLYVGMSRARYGLTILISESMRAQYREILKRKLN